MGKRTMIGAAVAAVIVAVPVLESISQDQSPPGAPPRLNAEAADVFGPPLPANLAAEAAQRQGTDPVVADEDEIVTAAEEVTEPTMDEIEVAAEDTPAGDAPSVVELPAPVETADAADEAAPQVRIVGEEASAAPYLVSPVREAATFAGEDAPVPPLDIGVSAAAADAAPVPPREIGVDTGILTASLPAPGAVVPVPRPAHERPAPVAAASATEGQATGTYVESYAGVQQPAHADVDYGEIFYGAAAAAPAAAPAPVHGYAAVPPAPHQGNIFLQDWVAPNGGQVQLLGRVQPGHTYAGEQQGVWLTPEPQPRGRVNYGDWLQQVNRTVQLYIGG